MALVGCNELVSKIEEIKMEQPAINVAFWDSKTTVIDTMKSPINNTRLSFIEFLVFLCAVAHQSPKGENLREKLTHMLPVILKAYGIAAEPIPDETNGEAK